MFLYRESYEAYESCLHWLADKDSLRSHILVAMGSLAYKVKHRKLCVAA